MANKKPYFDNNWEEYKHAPPEAFQDCSFDEFMTYKVANWELPSSVKCLMRITNTQTKKVEEKIYRRFGDAQNKMAQLLKDPDIEVVVCDHSSIHYITAVPEDEDDDDDED